ncbi:MAG: hypothetical protein RML93_04830, partial [Anaerolineales bacterium]|nr:hypothetical protein [Anaerolineales bacterium]MDW8446602.1 hypothetical protein [Anaerolineales bacterium]
LSDEIDHDDREEIHRFVQNFHRERPENLFSTAQEEEKRSKTSVNPEQILAAFYGIPASQPSQGAMDWTDFPLQIVIDLFREFLASISFESIYSPHRRPTRSLTELKSQFSKRARNQGVLCFQFVQRKDNLPIRVGDEWRVSELIFYPVQKLTTPKFLRSKGIKILNATFGELRPADQGFEAQLFDRWLRGYRLQFPDQESTETQSGSEGREHIAQFQKQLAEALELASTSSHTALSRFFTLIEAEIANPWTQKWLGEKTTDKLEQLRKKLLETKTSLPSKEHP